MENGADNLANQFKNGINNLNLLTDEQIDQLEKILEDYE
jgi:hypothetical protein